MAMDMPLRTVKTNIVQSIRAFRVEDLQIAAAQLGYHFLYANLANAQSKLERKNLDLMVANDVSQPGVGFQHDTNAVTFLTPNQPLHLLPLSDKRNVARALLDIVVEIRQSKATN